MEEISVFQKEVRSIKEWLVKEYVQLHTGNATPALLDGIGIEVYGSYQPIKNCASLSIEDPKTVRIIPWDKGTIKDIERALYAADMGFSIAVDESGIRVILPPLTTERRTHYVKKAKDLLEDARISIRKARESALTNLKNAELPEDVHARTKDEIQKYVQSGNDELEALYKKKEQEIMGN